MTSVRCVCLQVLQGVPSVAELGGPGRPAGPHQKRYLGGETAGLRLLADRVAWEEAALSRGVVLPNQYCPDLLGPPRSLSAYLRHGCISVRRSVAAARIQQPGRLHRSLHKNANKNYPNRS